MKPSKVAVFIIGEKLPDIVKYCLNQNAKILNSENILFEIVKLKRDFRFCCAGSQVEFEKMKYLINNDNSMVIDYDLEIIKIEDLYISHSLYCGCWNHNNRSDGFLIYCNTDKAKKDVEGIYNYVNHFPQALYPGYLYRSLFQLNTKEYPKLCYIHYNLNTGLTDVSDSIDSLKDTTLLNKVISAKNRIGDLWPV
jgi:hypothetical protein